MRIGSFDYALVDTSAQRSDELGFCDADKLVIGVDCSYPAQVVLATFYHEVKHAIFAQCALTDTSDEETVVSAMAPAELAFWRDNPDLFQILTDYVTGEI